MITPEHLEALIAAGETLDVEFKGEQHSPLSDADLIATAACLANRVNARPGMLLVGVEDDGRVTGARPRSTTAILDAAQVQALLANNTRPAVTCRVDVISVRGKQCLTVAGRHREWPLPAPGADRPWPTSLRAVPLP